MSTSIQPPANLNPSWRVRLQSFLQKLIIPHPSILDEGKRRRAKLLSALSLILMSLMVLDLAASGRIDIVLPLTAFALISYLLSRSRFFQVGAYFFIYSLTSVAYIRIYLGITDSVEKAIATTVPIALVLASALLPQGGFLLLTILSTLATFSAPLYSHVPPNTFDNSALSGGLVLTIGVILYGTDVLSANLDRERLKRLQDANKELEDIRSNLEQRVMERTSDLQTANIQIQNRTARLQAISEISQNIVINVNQDLQDLLTFIANSISEKTVFYHVGIFLLDENRDYAVLRAANSAGGKRMLERKHQLKVGGTGIVGYVSQSGRPRIALDTGADAVFFNNPDLPDTRSEMALPLKIGTQVIGTLDIQSNQSSAFSDEDVSVLNTLANQITIIIQYSLLQQRGDAVGIPLEGTKRSLQLNRRIEPTGFSYFPDGTLSSAVEIKDATIEKALETGEAVVMDQLSTTNTTSLAVPVKLRDEVIGILHVESTDGFRKWTDDEISLIQAVAERAALALENANLFEATERRATRERIIAEVTARIGESNDMDRILHTTIQELGRTLGATRTFIQLGASSSDFQEAAEFAPGEEDEII